tara:strand:+ start:199 stop:1446 length:1248 start_codon:yes stop_codon:yes gene_type:complete
MDEFDKLSVDLTKNLTKKEKKNNGIFFTCNSIITSTINYLNDYISKNNLDIIRILEPSCGSCQFINQIKNKMTYDVLHGVEYNKTIFNDIEKLYDNDNITLFNQDFLLLNSNIMYDLIIGNPPYFVINKPKDKEKLKYFKDNILKYKNEYKISRMNIYIIFIIKSLELLNINGIMAFVLPKNFLNCLYYNKLREKIFTEYKIVDIIDHSCNEYLETEQNTFMFIVQKCKGRNNSFTFKLDNNIIFNTKKNIKLIKKLYDNTTTLDKMGFKVCVGTCVWNQNKDILTNDSSKTRLIYNSNIVNNELKLVEFNNEQKKNYIDKKGKNDIILVVNRGYGKGEYIFNYCLIDINHEYLIENHLICIEYIDKIKKEELIKKYNTIIQSFNNNKTNEFIKLYFENNAINTTELQYVLPIFL